MAGELTDIDAVREYLQKEDLEDAQDPVINLLIPAASAAIRADLNRKIGIEETNAAHTFELDNRRGFLSFAPYDLRTLTEMRIDTDEGAGTVLTADTYRLYPRDRELGVWTYAKLRVSGFNSWGVREVRVTGDWGIAAASMPAEVKHWATITVVEWLRADVSMFTTNFDAVQERVIRPENLPSAVRHGLSHLRRESVL